jgi:hypothetical protein
MDNFVGLARRYLANTVVLHIETTQPAITSTGLLHALKEIVIALLSAHTVGRESVPIAKIVGHASVVVFIGLFPVRRTEYQKYFRYRTADWFVVATGVSGFCP